MSTTQTEPVAEPSETIERRFCRLKAEWYKATAHHSNPNIIMNHPAIREIIAMGQVVLPVILRDLRDESSLLIWAMPEITGENPVPPKRENGFLKWNISEQTNAWLQWGRQKGLV